MAVIPHEIEQELYSPIRELTKKYSLDDPQLPIEIKSHVDSFIRKNQHLEPNKDSIYNLVISHLHGYVIGRTEERALKEWVRIGLDGVKIVLESFLKYKELEIRKKELDSHKQ